MQAIVTAFFYPTSRLLTSSRASHTFALTVLIHPQRSMEETV